MFGPRINLFKVLGFPLRLDLSWLFIAVFLAWTLAAAYFPQVYPALSTGQYWAMGILGMLGLFISVVLHELGHAVVARSYNLEIRGITLFIFGGVAEMTEEPRSAKVELQVALAGPAVSLVLASLFWILGAAQPGTVATGIIIYLATVNTILLAFNLVPAFPLDGGRVLRAIIWHFGNNLRRATRICSRIGVGFGWVLVSLGLLNLLAGALVGAIWWVILGMFLRTAAISAYQQLLLRNLLEGETVASFMESNPVTVQLGQTLDTVVEEFVYKHHHKTYPVVDESNQLSGIITTRLIKEIPREDWSTTTVEEIMEKPGNDNTVGPGTDAIQALSIMNKNSLSRLLVVENGTLGGILTLKDLIKFFSLKVELEQ